MTNQDEYDMWNSLLVHPAWQRLVDYVEEQKALRFVAILKGVHDLREEDKLRGEYLGLELFVKVPITMVETLKVELDKLNKESQDGHE